MFLREGYPNAHYREGEEMTDFKRWGGDLSNGGMILKLGG